MTQSDVVTAHRSPRILVVDDSSLIRLYYTETLSRAGFEVEQAINGIEGMEKLLSAPFDLVIVDINMPRMDGLSFMRSLRRRPEDVCGIPALMITTEDGSEDHVEARAAAANYYLVKPITEQDLLRHVELLMGGKP